MHKNYKFYLESDLSGYAGRWTIIAGGRVVESGHDVKKMFARAKQEYPDEAPLVVKVPGPGLRM